MKHPVEISFDSNLATNIFGIKQCFWHTHRQTDRQTKRYTNIEIQG